MLARKPPSGAADCRLNLIEDQQGSDLLATGTQRGQKVRTGNPNPGLSLNRFHHDPRYLFVDGAQGVGIVKREDVDLGQQRLKGLSISWLARKRQSPEGISVVSSSKSDNAGTTRHLSAKLERPLDRLRSAVA
jgi:hypothetical protein